MQRIWMTVGSVVFCVLQFAPLAKPEACTVPLSCESSATSAGGVLLICPAGDGLALSDIGATISVTLLWCAQAEPLVDLPPQNVWIQSKTNADPRLCGGSGSSNADGLTDINGQTTISGTIAAGGYFGDGVYVVANGSFIQLGDGCDNPLPLILVSPDINEDLVVSLADLAIFATAFLSGGAVDPRTDFNGDGKINAVDLVMFAAHYRHSCR